MINYAPELQQIYYFEIPTFLLVVDGLNNQSSQRQHSGAHGSVTSGS